MKCSNCESSNLRICERRTTAAGIKKVRYRCKDCGSSFTTEDVKAPVSKRYVVTACQNDTPIHDEFLEALRVFSSHNSAKLIVIPITHLTPKNITDDPEWPDIDELSRDVIESKTFKILSQFKIPVSTLNPISGIDELSRGKHLIVPHPQLQMKTVPQIDNAQPVFIHTTGVISEPNYTDSKSGYKAKQNHSFSAVFIDEQESFTHMRVLNADESGSFYDLDKLYTSNGVQDSDHVIALVTGDEHAVVISDDVKAATYTNRDSIVNTLKPKYIVRHDVLDLYSGSHHHMNDHLLRYKKYIYNEDSVKAELDHTVQFIEETTPNFSQNIIVSSNHNDHLSKWLLLCDPKADIKNAKLYHWLNWKIMDSIDNGVRKSPFELYFEEFSKISAKFVGRNSSFKLAGIELSQHGDIGANGSRGSANQFSKLADKSIIGHSHSPKIEKGCYQVGTSTGRLEYANGASSWSNTHCIIHQNGRRQMVTIVNGRWK